jgi:probable F420-dependent oxidoreductase
MPGPHIASSNSQVTFGVSPVGLYPFGVPAAPVLFDFASTAERLGFASLWLGDHLAFHVPVLESLTYLTAVAARTERLKVGTSVYLLPLRHPTLVAKITSTLDILSAGRLIFGVGIGGENPREFEASGTEVRQRATRTDEGLEVLKRLWTESNVTHHGRHYRFTNVTLEPKPVQKPHPPIWIGARSDAGLRRAARTGDGWVSVMITPARYRSCQQHIIELAQQHSRSLDGFVFAHYAFLYVTDNLPAGRRMATEFLSRLYNQPFETLIDRIGIVGPAEACVEKLQQFIDAGVAYLILAPTCNAQEQVKQLEIFAERLVPQLCMTQRGALMHTLR